MRHRIEPLVDHAGKVGLAAGQHVAHRLDARGGVGLDPDELGHLLGAVVARSQRPGHDQPEGGQYREPGDDDDHRPGQVEKTVAHPEPCTAIRTAWERRANTIDPGGRTPYIAAMALRDIIILPDKRLRLVSEPAKAIDTELRL